MFKKLSLLIVLITSFQASSVFAAYGQPSRSQSNSVTCAPQLRHCLAAIEKLPEARQLIADVQREGAIRITVNNNTLSNQFGAFWDQDHRLICVSLPASDGELIASIIFELHNAAANSKLEHFDYLATTGNIDKESYVRSVEHLEYENSLKASKIATKGIQLGIFPASAHLPTYSNFEEHYRIQKMGGHSAWIAKNYDQLAPRYSGRWRS